EADVLQSLRFGWGCRNLSGAWLQTLLCFSPSGQSGSRFAKQLLKSPFAFHREAIPVRVELVPDVPIGAADIAKPRDTPALVGGVEGGKITQLHGDGVRRPLQYFRQLDDVRVSAVTLAETELAVKVKGHDQFVTSPRAARHGVQPEPRLAHSTRGKGLLYPLPD